MDLEIVASGGDSAAQELSKPVEAAEGLEAAVGRAADAIETRLDAAFAEVEKSAKDLEEQLDKLPDPLRDGLSTAEESLAKFSKVLATGEGDVAKFAVQAEEALKRVREEIAAGADVTDEQREALSRLEGQLDENITRSREYQDALGDMRARVGEVRDAHGAFASAFPRVTEVVGKGVLALGVLKESYQGTREAVKLVEETLGISIDSWIRESIAIRGAAEALAGYNAEASDGAADLDAYERAQAKLLAKRPDLSKSTKEAAAEAARLREEYEKLRGEIDPTIAAEREHTETVARLQKMHAAGAISAEELAAELGKLADAEAAAAGSMDNAAGSAAGQRGELDKLTKATDEATASTRRLEEAQRAFAAAQSASKDAAKDQADLESRLADLRSRDFLSASELDELRRAEDSLADARNRSTQARDEATLAELDLGNQRARQWEQEQLAREQAIADENKRIERQKELNKVMKEFAAITREANAEVKALAENAQALNAILDGTAAKLATVQGML